jgi:hypothetical protein
MLDAVRQDVWQPFAACGRLVPAWRAARVDPLRAGGGVA